MPYHLDDTIVAIASSQGGGARGIVRLSGPEIGACLRGTFSSEPPVAWETMTSPVAIPGRLRLMGCASALPCELYIWPTPRSYTGQPVAEIHTLGCPPLLEAAVKTLCAAGARLAEPGEFTLRAFLAGRMDLTRAEAVLGVVDAPDSRSLQVALNQLAGGLGTPLARLRDALVDLLAHLEAGFDFAEEDITFLTPDELDRQLADAQQTIEQLMRRIDCRGVATERPRVVLIGWPNTGKSSLFNALVGHTAALVSEQPGTTRDYLTAELDLHTTKCLLVDTAGVDPESSGLGRQVDQAAQDATAQQARQASLELLCLDSSRPLNGWERQALAENPARRIAVLTKADLPARIDWDGPAVRTSSITGQGLQRLRERIAEMLLADRFAQSDMVPATAARCHQSLQLAAQSLRQARQLLRNAAGEELVAVELRLALEELGRVVGAVYTDDILDRIFSRFCVGK